MTVRVPSPIETLDCRQLPQSLGGELRSSPEAGSEAWLRRVAACAASLPAELRAACMAMRQRQGPVGLWLRGFPTPVRLPPTPDNCEAPPRREDSNGEFWLAAVGSLLGDLFSHADICGGDLFHHIAPTPGEETAPSGESSLSRLRMHTDGASHPLPPDYILLWCHRSGHARVGTHVASMSTVVGELEGGQVRCLRRPVFTHQLDYEFHRQGLRLRTDKKPILAGEEGNPTVSLDVDFVEAKTDEEREALAALEEVAERTAEPAHLEPGDILVIDNRRSLHARDRFVPRYDGEDRWLQAAYVRAEKEVPPGITWAGRVAHLSGLRKST